MATPTSPKTASHMLAMPNAASRRISTFTPMANTMFCQTIRMVLRATRMAWAILEGRSSMRTTSAASIAASEPIAPMATPTSARMSTGASLMPSPTKARRAPSFSPASKRSTASTLSWGRSCAWTSSIPRRPATASATSWRSPVSMTQRRTPAAWRSRTASSASSFTTSAITMWPTYSPSTVTCRIVPVRSQSCQAAPCSAMSLSLPTSTRCSFTSALTPWPDSSRASAILPRSIWPE